jgi:cell division protein FtsL
MSLIVPTRSRSVTLSSVLLQLLPGAILCLLFASVGILHVTSRVRIVSVGYELSELENEHRELTRENDRLKLELATLKSPSRLERLAREKLGMGPPPATSIVLLQPSGPVLGRAPVARAREARVASRAAVTTRELEASAR